MTDPPVDAGQPPHVLVFEVRAVAPLEHLQQEEASMFSNKELGVITKIKKQSAAPSARLQQLCISAQRSGSCHVANPVSAFNLP